MNKLGQSPSPQCFKFANFKPASPQLLSPPGAGSYDRDTSATQLRSGPTSWLGDLGQNTSPLRANLVLHIVRCK